MSNDSIETYFCDIYIAGDIQIIRQVCREYCMAVGLCVTVTETDFIYTGGEETGAIIGLVNYPRFPDQQTNIFAHALHLGNQLMLRCCQKSWLLMTPEKTFWQHRDVGK